MDDSIDPPKSQSWLQRIKNAFSKESEDRDALVEHLRTATKNNVITEDALAMIEGALQVAQMQVRDIMVPRSQMVTLEEENDLQSILPTVVESGYSRFPVIGAHRDEVVGILHAKELLNCFSEPEKPFVFRDIIRPAVFVPESKRLNTLLQEFRGKHYHLAIVVDEYGGVSGVATIEDILEQIVGEIEDEYDFDEEESHIKKHSDGSFIIKAMTPIEDFNAQFNTKLDHSEFDTLGGLMMKAFGRVPRRGESTQLAGYQFKVLRSDNRRLHLLQMIEQTQQ